MREIKITEVLAIIGIISFLIGIIYGIFQCIIGNAYSPPNLFFKISTCGGLSLTMIGILLHFIITKNEK